jgi:hypothetical protein
MEPIMKLLTLVTAMTLVLSVLLNAEEAATTPTEQTSQKPAQESLQAILIPPEGWRFAERSVLPKNVHLMVVGQGKFEMPPSINLALEPFKGSLKEYLQIVKEINAAKGDDWKDLGTINTEAGPASLSQLDTKTQWGNVRMMHIILLKDGTIYILTAAARKEEFPDFYREFFRAMKSFHFEKKSEEKEKDIVH